MAYVMVRPLVICAKCDTAVHFFESRIDVASMHIWYRIRCHGELAWIKFSEFDLHRSKTRCFSYDFETNQLRDENGITLNEQLNKEVESEGLKQADKKGKEKRMIVF